MQCVVLCSIQCVLSSSVLCMYCLRCRYCQYWHQLSPEPDEKVREKVEKGKYLEDNLICVFQFSVFCVIVFLSICILCDCGQEDGVATQPYKW